MKARKVRSLSKESKRIMINVTRNGNAADILIDNVLVGDVVILRTGDQVPADGLFIDGYDLRIDESSLTGETDLSKKSKYSPFLKSGTQAAE
jgi:Ca2+-transporting ATPase